MKEITREQLKAVIPTATAANIDLYLPFLNEQMPQYGIITGKEKGDFIATIAHESSNLRLVIENLNYSANALRATFPRYFQTDDIALSYSRQPEKIANRAYANRNGNGDEQSGDGWKFRGRGLLQVTGRYNYNQVGKGLKLDLINNPDLLCQPRYAVQSACWWWRNAGLSKT